MVDNAEIFELKTSTHLTILLNALCVSLKCDGDWYYSVIQQHNTFQNKVTSTESGRLEDTLWSLIQFETLLCTCKLYKTTACYPKKGEAHYCDI
jgi:hypothetical protein